MPTGVPAECTTLPQCGAARPANQGLLIIYPLDPKPLGVTSTETVIALALSLPRTSDGSSSSIVNQGVTSD